MENIPLTHRHGSCFQIIRQNHKEVSNAHEGVSDNGPGFPNPGPQGERPLDGFPHPPDPNVLDPLTRNEAFSRQHSPPPVNSTDIPQATRFPRGWPSSFHGQVFRIATRLRTYFSSFGLIRCVTANELGASGTL